MPQQSQMPVFHCPDPIGTAWPGAAGMAFASGGGVTAVAAATGTSETMFAVGLYAGSGPADPPAMTCYRFLRPTWQIAQTQSTVRAPAP